MTVQALCTDARPVCARLVGVGVKLAAVHAVGVCVELAQVDLGRKRGKVRNNKSVPARHEHGGGGAPLVTRTWYRRMPPMPPNPLQNCEPSCDLLVTNLRER